MTQVVPTIRYNNPFALIQLKPDNWVGLKGKTEGNFLIFDTPFNGARAGWINLYNTYLKKGRNTANQIIPIYAPDSGGMNNNYVQFVAARMGITADTPITTAAQIWELGRAIVFFEAGRAWYADTELYRAYLAAAERVPLPKLTSPSPESPGSPGAKGSKKKAPIALIVGLAVTALIALTLWTNKQNKRQ